jgi:hypothetical protein
VFQAIDKICISYPGHRKIHLLLCDLTNAILWATFVKDLVRTVHGIVCALKDALRPKVTRDGHRISNWERNRMNAKFKSTIVAFIFGLFLAETASAQCLLSRLFNRETTYTTQYGGYSVGYAYMPVVSSPVAVPADPGDELPCRLFACDPWGNNGLSSGAGALSAPCGDHELSPCRLALRNTADGVHYGRSHRGVSTRADRL